MSCETVREALSTASIAEIPEILSAHDCADCRALADAIVAQDQALHAAVGAWVAHGPPATRQVPWPWIALALATAATILVVLRTLWAPVAEVRPAGTPPIPPAPESEQEAPSRTETPTPPPPSVGTTRTPDPQPSPRPSPRPVPAPAPR